MNNVSLNAEQQEKLVQLSSFYTFDYDDVIDAYHKWVAMNPFGMEFKVLFDGLCVVAKTARTNGYTTLLQAVEGAWFVF